LRNPEIVAPSRGERALFEAIRCDPDGKQPELQVKLVLAGKFVSCKVSDNGGTRARPARSGAYDYQ
jgi:hypothetical protein